MASPTFDTNQWYQLYVNEDKTQSLLGTSLYNKGGTKGAVFFNSTNPASKLQRWQIFPVAIDGTTAYILRSGDSGPNGFVGAGYSEDDENEGKTRPQMFRGDIASNNVYWSFNNWGDGTFFLTNAANGTTYHMNKRGDGIVSMSSNITAPQNGQRWNFAAIDKINDEKFSSVNLVGIISSTSRASTVSVTSSISQASTLSSASPSTTVDPSASNSSSSGLSTGVKAAIGAVVGGVFLIVLVLFGLYFWKKRKQRLHYAQPQELPHNEPIPKYEMYQDTSTKYEMPSRNIYEVANHEKPTELPGHTSDAQGRYP